MAAVNEAAREEQFQSYLNTGKCVSENLDFYSDSRTDNISSLICSTSPTKTPEIPKETSKPLTFDSITNKLFSNRCHSSADEYVDINEFIEKKTDDGKSDDNVLIQRSRRKKTSNRKNDERMVFRHFSFMLFNLFNNTYNFN